MPQNTGNKRLSKAAASPPSEEEHVVPLPSKATLEEVRKLFEQYSEELESNGELSQTSKTMYIDFAGCFVRWMYGGFKPGSRGSNRRMPTIRIWPGKVD